jgi:hypothetical protein
MWVRDVPRGVLRHREGGHDEGAQYRQDGNRAGALAQAPAEEQVDDGPQKR